MPIPPFSISLHCDAVRAALIERGRTWQQTVLEFGRIAPGRRESRQVPSAPASLFLERKLDVEMAGLKDDIWRSLLDHCRNAVHLEEIRDTEERVRVVAKSYMESPQSTLILSPDNASRRELNVAVLKTSHLLSEIPAQIRTSNSASCGLARTGEAPKIIVPSEADYGGYFLIFS